MPLKILKINKLNKKELQKVKSKLMNYAKKLNLMKRKKKENHIIDNAILICGLMKGMRNCLFMKHILKILIIIIEPIAN